MCWGAVLEALGGILVGAMEGEGLSLLVAALAFALLRKTVS